MKLFVKMTVLAALIPGMAMAAGDPAAGQAKSMVCAACHGASGEGSPAFPTYPKLQGQNAGYIEQALQAYKAGQRTSPQAAIMKPMADPLTDADVANLAAYFASK